jgi:glycine hydroxymethyltransferase
VTGGTDNHLFVVDMRSKNINGLIAETALQKAGITVSRSCIPFDPERPWITSGIRIGTPAITTRGMKQKEAFEIVALIDEVINHVNDDAKLRMIKEQVLKLCKKFPITYAQ